MNKKYLSIDGITFTITRGIINNPRCSTRTLKDCYGKPSSRKIAIFNSWFEWAVNNDVKCFGISSYNTNIFTLNGIIEYNGDKYYMYITPTRRELTLIF